MDMMGCKHDRYVRLDTIAEYYDRRKETGENAFVRPVQGWLTVCLDCKSVRIHINGGTENMIFGIELQ